MDVRKKTILTAVLVVAVVGILIVQTQNKALFKGQLFGDKDRNAEEETEESSDNLLPDLSVDLKVIPPAEQGGDLNVDVTITNEGPGNIAGDEPFKYAVYLNDIEVFANSDSYTSMEAGDSFNFIYPVSKLIYQYPDTGTVSVIVDMDDGVEELNEENNSKELTY